MIELYYSWAFGLLLALLILRIA